MYQYNRGGFFANIPLVIRNIIIINAFMLILTMINREFMLQRFALFYPASPFFKPWQIVSHIFMHGNFGHLLFNMYALWMFGSVLEQLWGPKKFLLYYLVTGLGAAALHMGVQWIEASSLVSKINENGVEAMQALTRYRMLMNTPTVGASGAVYGILLAYGMLFPNNELRIIFLPIALKAKYFVIIFAVIELVLGLVGGGNIAHFAHLGGMIFGFILVRYWRKRNRLYY
ncbi:MAG: rhomboid family intramembrane serine protease [Bacteroidales bacterium]|jgi:membrane associated rhomboid family serine protease|nr:rhomboid family intramembrane serine protease [Bacteroidales bacterium]MDD2824707.1 rhomboid family intramembrane serine protease [Bacteroidales bacterium]MDD3101202.1 rhomboid family intramembrane serine protease [Bacteroidales bacterium]MDD3639612.1 rhomboid family intramembrane serine protease [Bacteroidales bacterium]MDD3944400.1 rhomboid family intramembrane serine protease [Bacteroidales bacterium]